MDYWNMMNYNQQIPQTIPYRQNLAKTQNVDWITVQTIEQVENVNVQPGTKSWIMVQNVPVFALRVADQMGLVSTEFYKFEKYIPEDIEKSTSFVTKEEMKKAIDDAIKEVKNESTTRQVKSSQKNESNH